MIACLNDNFKFIANRKTIDTNLRPIVSVIEIVSINTQT